MKHSSQRRHFETKQIYVVQCSKVTWPIKLVAKSAWEIFHKVPDSVDFYWNYWISSTKKNVQSSIKSERTIRASFTKQGKLAWERDSKTALMGVEISTGDLLTTCELKDTDATSHLHIDQRNIPSVAQISVVANKEIKKPQYIEKKGQKNKGCKKFRFTLYCVTPSWGFQVVFYFLKQIKNNMA